MIEKSINIVFLESNSDGVTEEKVFSCPLESILVSGKESEVLIPKIIGLLKYKSWLEPNTHEYLVSYFSFVHNVFVYIGTVDNLNVPVVNLGDLGEQIYLKFRIRSIPNIDGENLNQKGKEDSENVFRRTKERKIEEVVKKVIQWRAIYNTPDENGKTYSLDEAAVKVGMSKKSLDDYLIQIRNARRFGFNFNEHKNEKIGVLRDFNKKNKHLFKKGKPGRKPKRRV